MNFTVIKSWVMLFTYGLSIVLCLLSGSGVKPVVHISSNACNVQIGSGNVMIVNDVRRKRSTKSQPIPEPMITGILNVQSRSTKSQPIPEPMITGITVLNVQSRSTKSQPTPEPMITGITILNVQSRSHLNDTRLHNRNEMITSHK